MESDTQVRAKTAEISGREAQADKQGMKVSDVMSKEVVTALPDDTVFAAVQRMSESGVSCLVVTDGERVLGILTERDVLRAVGGPQANLHRVTVAQIMSSPVQSVPAASSIITASRIMQARQIRRLPVLEGKWLVGIVTQTDITRGLITLTPLTSISDIMTRDVITIEVDALVSEAARVMASKRISCLVATRHGELAGIVTEKDLMQRIVVAQRDPTGTHVADVMSFPVTMVPPSYSVLGVSRKMDALHLHRLVVMDEGRLCGIITQTDIMRAVRRQLEQVENERWGWMTDLVMRVQVALSDLQKLEELLRKLNSAPAASRHSADTGRISAESQVETVASTPARR